MNGLFLAVSRALAALVFATVVPQSAGALPPASQGAHQAPPLPVKSEAPSKAEGKPVTGGGAKTESKDGAASLQEVLSRISAAVADQNAKLSAGADVAPHPQTTRSRSTASRAAEAKTRPQQKLLTWDPVLTSGGVTLSWDDQLTPRHARSADLGVRLVWPARIP